MRTSALLAAAALVLLAGCSEPEDQEDVVPGQEHLIAIHARDYHPGSLTMASADALRFENHETVAHTATAVGSPMGTVDSGDIAPNGDHTFTDLEPGTYNFTCRHHASMRLTVTVQAA